MAISAGKSTETEIPTHIQPGFQLLLRGQQYAQELGRDRWDFAVEIATLRAAGLTNNDFRWLICKGFVQHGREVTLANDPSRRFQRCSGLRFFKTTCFVLNSSGHAENGGLEANSADAGSEHTAVHGNGHADVKKPQWDQDRRQFRLGALIIKEFKLPAVNQETVLTAFEEEGWPPFIDDPLPPLAGIEPKRRLHDTIKNLNRHQKAHVVRFMGDGTGQGIRWELMAQVGKRD